ncbi:MAG: heavy metal translocating P-type ATPase [Thermosynechococcaceae cyanobacterium MS004]|nr:heavy metal translocating P-type ATPase [Thermosynechococcaceae cyanobacterium MS004]
MPQAILAEAQEAVLQVQGMKCAGCAQAVERALSQKPGVVSASVNLVTEKALIFYQADQVRPDALAIALTDIGFPTQVETPAATASLESSVTSQSLASTSAKIGGFHSPEFQQIEFQKIGLAIALVTLSAVGHLHSFFPWPIPLLGTLWFHWGLATLALLLPGRRMIQDGWQSWRRNMPNMNTLVSLGALTAYGASCAALWVPKLGWECFFDAPVMIVGLVLLGRTLEEQARGRATAALRALMSLQPAIARQLAASFQVSAQAPEQVSEQVSAQAPEQASEQPQSPLNPELVPIDQVPIDQVQVGALLQVLPGDKFPVDGLVKMGQSWVDESMLTGESRPVEKSVNAPVMAGTLNQSQVLVIEATRTGQETALAQIVQLVETAQTRKAPIQRLADRVAGYFVYGVMAIAVLTFVFWATVGTHLWPEVLHLVHFSAHAPAHAPAHSLSNAPSVVHSSSGLLLSLKLAIAVLVVACPCALGLATPTAIVVGTSLGAEQGLLIRGGDVLEAVHHLDTIVFDKTGTLTTGIPVVTHYWLSHRAETAIQSPEQLLQYAASLEASAQHPFAVAIQAKAQELSLAQLEVTDWSSQGGLGLMGNIGDRRVCLGSAAWIASQGAILAEGDRQRVEALAAEGHSIVVLSLEGQYVGGIAIQDTLRPDALETIQTLRQQGLQVRMLTGDQRLTAEAIGQTLGLTTAEIDAEVLPTDKAKVIQALQAQGKSVGMVGDGINDAPALAQANVGIALSSGTDVAIETAQIVLMGHLTRSAPQLKDVVKAIALSKATFRTIQQNLFWAFGYNLLGIPAAAGVLLPGFGLLLSPAAAAALMALSSVSVVTNSLRLRSKALEA